MARELYNGVDVPLEETTKLSAKNGGGSAGETTIEKVKTFLQTTFLQKGGDEATNFKGKDIEAGSATTDGVIKGWSGGTRTTIAEGNIYSFNGTDYFPLGLNKGGTITADKLGALTAKEVIADGHKLTEKAANNGAGADAGSWIERLGIAKLLDSDMIITRADNENGVGICANTGVQILIVNDISNRGKYLYAVGYKKDSQTPTFTVLGSNELTLGASTLANQIVLGGESFDSVKMLCLTYTLN